MADTASARKSQVRATVDSLVRDQDRLYEQWIAKHVQHPGERGSTLAKPDS
jgi:hypothetical protein